MEANLYGTNTLLTQGQKQGSKQGLSPLQNILMVLAKHFNFLYYWVVKCEEVLFYFKEMGLLIVMKHDFIFNFL
jgi:hypothetical protein